MTSTTSRYFQLLRIIVDKKSAIAILVTTALVSVGATLTALSPAFLKKLIDDLMHVSGDTNLAFLWLGAYLLSMFFSRTLNDLRWAVYGVIEQDVKSSLQRRFFKSIFRQPYDFFIGKNASEITGIMSAAVDANRSIMINTLFVIFPTLLQLAIGSGVLLSFGYHWAVAAAAAYTMIYLYFHAGFTTKITFIHRAANREAHRGTSLLGDAITNFESIRQFNAQFEIYRRYSRIALDMRAAWKDFYRQRVRNGLAQGLAFIVAIGLCLAKAITDVSHGTMSIGDFILVNAYLFQVCQPLDATAMAIRDVRQGLIQMEPFFLITAPGTNTRQRIERRDTFSAQCGNKAYRNEVAVSFRNVALRRDGQENVLSDVSFDIRRGTTFAIVGPTGAGKSTIIKLLAGLFPPTSGSIEVNGSTISYGKSAAAYKIGVVPQDIVLFNDSMAFNIGLGKPGASLDEITDAANRASLGDLIERLPDGFQTMVGNQGLRLSGGERQRVAIARVLLADPDIILCDEATSSLDVLTEAKIVADLMNAANGKTILLVAHRYASIQSADRVIVIEAGHITEQGTPAQLAAADGWFSQMVKRNQISA